MSFITEVFVHLNLERTTAEAALFLLFSAEKQQRAFSFCHRDACQPSATVPQEWHHLSERKVDGSFSIQGGVDEAGSSAGRWGGGKPPKNPHGALSTSPWRSQGPKAAQTEINNRQDLVEDYICIIIIRDIRLSHHIFFRVKHWLHSVVSAWEPALDKEPQMKREDGTHLRFSAVMEQRGGFTAGVKM